LLDEMYREQPIKSDAGDGLTIPHHRQILKKLIAHKDMAKAWESLRKRAADPRGPWRAIRKKITAAFDEPYFAQDIWALVRWNVFVQPRPLHKFITHAVELGAREIHAVHFHAAVCEALNWPTAARQTLPRMRAQGLAIAEQARQLAERVEKFSPLAGEDFVHRLYDLAAADEEEDFVDHLYKLAAAADEAVAKAEHNGPIVQRPTAKNAERIYFCRVLTAKLRECYGMPLWDVVARTARAVFNDDSITIQTVRNAVTR
jgi:hypothetical protein